MDLLKKSFKLILLCSFYLSPTLLFAEEKEEQFQPASFYLKEMIGDFAAGSKDAKIKVIEYSSLSCYHCAYFHQEIFDKIKQHYIDTGKVRWINRQYVGDAPSMKGSLLAGCGNDERYFLFLKVLFAKQSSWVFNKNFEDNLKNIAKLGGISDSEFSKCMENETLKEYLVKQKLVARQALGIKGTPAFFVNGNFAQIQSLKAFEKLYDEELAKIDGNK